MAVGARSRVAIVAILVAFQAVVFAGELLFITPIKTWWRDRRRWWYTTIRHLVGPILVGFLGVILIPITYTTLDNDFPDANDQCRTDVDADIGGDGVRISIWVQEAVLLTIAILGTFHPFSTGAKEVGAGLVITHVSLVIAILVQMGQQTLTSVNAVVGAMILDAQNNVLSIQLVAKETLASRWQVWVVLLSQALGIVVLPIVVANFTRGSFTIEDCNCFSAFWWAWLSDCATLSGESSEASVFWVYYGFRCLIFCQSCFHSLYNTRKFHEAEKDERDASNESRATLDGITYPDPVFPPESDAIVTYADYPATATLMYTVHGIFGLTSMATAEVTIRRFSLGPSSQVNSVGQVIAIVVASATVSRAAWLFLMMFYRQSGQWKNWLKNRGQAQAKAQIGLAPLELETNGGNNGHEHDDDNDNEGHGQPIPTDEPGIPIAPARPRLEGATGAPRRDQFEFGMKRIRPGTWPRNRTYAPETLRTSLEQRRPKFGLVWPFTFELAKAMYFQPPDWRVPPKRIKLKGKEKATEDLKPSEPEQDGPNGDLGPGTRVLESTGRTITLNAGSAQGVAPGAEYIVYRRYRDGEQQKSFFGLKSPTRYTAYLTRVTDVSVFRATAEVLHAWKCEWNNEGGHESYDPQPPPITRGSPAVLDTWALSRPFRVIYSVEGPEAREFFRGEITRTRNLTLLDDVNDPADFVVSLGESNPGIKEHEVYEGGRKLHGLPSIGRPELGVDQCMRIGYVIRHLARYRDIESIVNQPRTRHFINSDFSSTFSQNRSDRGLSYSYSEGIAEPEYENLFLEMNGRYKIKDMDHIRYTFRYSGETFETVWLVIISMNSSWGVEKLYPGRYGAAEVARGEDMHIDFTIAIPRRYQSTDVADVAEKILVFVSAARGQDGQRWAPPNWDELSLEPLPEYDWHIPSSSGVFSPSRYHFQDDDDVESSMPGISRLPCGAWHAMSFELEVSPT
ncbi:hypothetical protein F5Y04DRAFT_240822 [Hypomontagnella monticulosa]|nr:hypothetical protein F5Y04DRAFT_240822 [Hypomontagnella monticulosa]